MRAVRNLVFSLLFLSGYAEACTCADPRLSEQEQLTRAFDDATLVVVARVGKLAASAGETIVTTTGVAEVLESFKSAGNSPSHLPIQMRASREGYTSSCDEGADLHEGDYLLLYLSEPRITEWSFDYCLRSRVVKRRTDLENEVARLRTLAGEGQLCAQLDLRGHASFKPTTAGCRPVSTALALRRYALCLASSRRSNRRLNHLDSSLLFQIGSRG
jgi:hypothetical protein